RNDKVIHRTTR
ncbi:hypothetical protein D021_1323B, partial [Vibrio parahaemolyticus 10296]